MKAAVNGGLNLSMLDVWWVEGCIEGVTGWSIDDATRCRPALHDKLEHVVLPLYYQDHGRWCGWMNRRSASSPGTSTAIA